MLMGVAGYDFYFFLAGYGVEYLLCAGVIFSIALLFGGIIMIGLRIQEVQLVVTESSITFSNPPWSFVNAQAADRKREWAREASEAASPSYSVITSRGVGGSEADWGSC